MQPTTPILHFPNDLAQATAFIKAGECVAIKTETVYGLAADASNEDAVKAIFKAKARPATNPLIVHIASIADMKKWARDIPSRAYLLAEKYWPGPLSLLLKKQPWVSNTVTGGQDTVVLRMPASDDFISLINAAGVGLAAPSANKYKFISPTSADHVLTSLHGRIAAVVDGGRAEVGIESTIIDVTGETPCILRPGPINRDSLKRDLQTEVTFKNNEGLTVPGSVLQHYQPNTPVKMLSRDALMQKRFTKSEGLISHSSYTWPLEKRNHIQLSPMPQQYSRDFYDALHQLDKQGLSCIYIEALPKTESWFALNNRLSRVVALG
ncbi:L-threonylcarbamoyladenylate synthase [Alteromonas sp. BMJM2]|uniref:L-threonylcarbamoyladenylate synthase n=1 Tax=Alteromonas sp. BMJM2 TaxID=2954241 RepID=UPI0022B3FE52|nr:L-threonylcarbamoyladenylate synthase [Alteromonas sp. BMJM2]